MKSFTIAAHFKTEFTSWFIQTTDEITQRIQTWKTSVIGSSFQSSSTTRSIRCFLWFHDLFLFVFGNRTKSNMLFSVNDFDRSVIEHSTELDNQPFDTQTIDFLKKSQVKSSQVKSSQVKSSQVKSSQVKSSQVKSTIRISITMLAGVWVRFRRNERENLSIQAK